MSEAAQKIKQLCNEILNDDDPDLTNMNTYWDRLNVLQMCDQIDISGLDFTGKDGFENECIQITNRGGNYWDISQWRISAESDEQTTLLPKNTLLSPGETICIYTGGQGKYSFHSNRPIWNDAGDAAILQNAQGKEISKWLYGRAAHPYIRISYIHYDGKQFRTEGDEYVELSNASAYLIDLSHWKLKSRTNQATFIFPPDSIITANGTVRIYTNCDKLKPGEFSFNSSHAIWNNNGGWCELTDYNELCVSQYFY